ncbi:hypothetical protein F5Y12DRAFT_711428 [Xylaria sp. FL1777]|nr:hypothetical protein F5Y12DRAFT_711428 [Xylaria sp. FL1777]
MGKNLTTPDLYANPYNVSNWIECAWYNSKGQLFINSMGSFINSWDEPNLCYIVATLPEAPLSDYLVDGRHGERQLLDTSKLIVEHKIVRGEWCRIEEAE